MGNCRFPDQLTPSQKLFDYGSVVISQALFIKAIPNQLPALESHNGRWSRSPFSYYPKLLVLSALPLDDDSILRPISFFISFARHRTRVRGITELLFLASFAFVFFFRSLVYVYVTMYLVNASDTSLLANIPGFCHILEAEAVYSGDRLQNPTT